MQAAPWSRCRLAAPSSLSTEDARLQQDVARADTALIGMTAALSTGDQGGYDARRIILQQAFAAVDGDATVILNG